MTILCKKCGKEVIQTEGKRIRVYCDDKCRMQYNRLNPVNTEQTITEQINTEQAGDSITEQPEQIAGTVEPEQQPEQTDKLVGFSPAPGFMVDDNPIYIDTNNALPDNFGLVDCECWHCKQNRSQPANKQWSINHGPYLPASILPANTINRVSLPGDSDYDGCCKFIDDKWQIVSNCG